MSVSARVRRVVCTVTGAVMLVAIAAMPAGAGKDLPTKPYVATIAPDTVAAGAGQAFTLTLQNLSDQQQIGSANVVPPAGFTLTSESSPFATVSGNVLQLRSLSLIAGSSVSVAFAGDVPCTGTASLWCAPGRNGATTSTARPATIRDGRSERCEHAGPGGVPPRVRGRRAPAGRRNERRDLPGRPRSDGRLGRRRGAGRQRPSRDDLDGDDHARDRPGLPGARTTPRCRGRRS